MKISVAQVRPTGGAVEQNLERHESLIELAASKDSELIVFPELSLTGYEPSLAAKLSRTESDECFDLFQSISDEKQISIGVGVPIRRNNQIHISLLVFQPQRRRRTYSKMYLHPDEQQFFTAGSHSDGLIGTDPIIALAICYELSVPQHAASAFAAGATVYIASVAKTSKGVDQASQRLAQIAREYSILVLMSNCVGLFDGGQCAGRSSAWDSKGNLIAQLDDVGEGLILVDSQTEQAAKYDQPTEK